MDLEQVLKNSNALHIGHTEFKNGKHGNGWLQKDLIVRNPIFLDEMAKLQADNILKSYPEVSMLLGPVTGGAIVVSHVAKYIGKEFGVILGKQDPVIFHDMNIPIKDDKVVIVEDIISSGTDMGRYINFLKKESINILGVSVWLNRQTDRISEIEVVSLLKNPFKTYEKDTCPLCAGDEKILFKNIRE